MNARNVISPKNIPASLPYSATIATGLLLDRINAPGWVWGALGTVFAVVWVSVVIDISTRKETKVLP